MGLNWETAPFGPGAGVVKTLEQVEEACKAPFTRLTVGSITLDERLGNQGDTYYFHPHEQWSLNSLGLPNRGLAYYKEVLPTMAKLCHNNQKELWVSIAGFSPKEYGVMAEACLKGGADGVEINLSCPNVWNNGERKRMPAEDPGLASHVLTLVHNYTQSIGKRNFTVKLSPTKDDVLLASLAKHIIYNDIRFVVCSNTIPNRQRKKEGGQEALSFTSGNTKTKLHAGGLAGSAVFEESVWMVHHMRNILPKTIAVIGCGGIFGPPEVQKYIDAGADGFQCTTSCVEYGYDIFTQIALEMA